MSKSNRNEKDHNKYWLQSFEDIAKNYYWESKYDSLSFITYNFLSRRESVIKLINGANHELVLDLGCGTGEYYEALSNCTKSYIGLDYSSSMISRAKNKYNNIGLKPKFIVGSGVKIPFDDNKFDMVCAIGYIQYFIDPSQTLKEISRVLKPGGSLIIQSFQNYPFKPLFFGKIRKFLRLIYYKIRNREYLDYSNIPYSKKELDKLLYNHGFKIKDYDHSNFIVFPFLKYFPNLYVKLSEIIHNNYSDKFERFAVNYNARYNLNK